MPPSHRGRMRRTPPSPRYFHAVFSARVWAKRFLRVSLWETEGERTRERRGAKGVSNDLQKQFVRGAKSCGRIPRAGSPELSGSRRSQFSRRRKHLIILRDSPPNATMRRQKENMSDGLIANAEVSINTVGNEQLPLFATMH